MKESWRIGIAQERKKVKFLKCWLNVIGSTTGPEVCRHNFVLGLVREGGLIITCLLAYRTAAILPSLHLTPFLCFLSLLAWLKLIWILFRLTTDENNLRQFPIPLYRTNLLALDFSPNDPFGSRRNWKNTRPFKYKYPPHSHKIHSLATTNYPTSPRRNSPTHSSHLNIQKSLHFSSTGKPANHQHSKMFKDISSTTRKYSKTFHQKPGNIQRLFRLQKCLSRKSSISPKNSNTFQAASSIPAATSNYPARSIPAATSNQQQQPATTINYSNQQQQPATTINCSNQQQQPATATSSSDQQQQSTAATCISNQHPSYQQHLHNQRRLPLVITWVPSCSFHFSTFLKFIFWQIFPFFAKT